jgi:carbohydrate-selective porin OprB
MKKITAMILIASVGVATADQPVAEPTSKPWYEEDRLFDGRRDMEESGINLFLYFDSIWGANITGGIKNDQDFTAQIYAGADFDLEKLMGAEDTVAKISMVNRQGNGVAPNVGGIYDPMCIYGGPDGQKTILYQLWVEKIFDEKLAVKIGRDSECSDFANNDLYRYSLSTAINGPIRSMMLDSLQIVSFPLGVWHGRVKYTFDDEHQLQVGAYQVNDTLWSDTLPGTDFSFRSDDGVTFMAQYDWTPDVYERPARLYVGIANSAYDYTDFDGGNTDNLFRLYGHFDFEVVEGLKLFTFGAYTGQSETAKVPLQLSGGANWKGLIPGRENDHTMCFVTYGQLSDEYGDSIGEDMKYEMVYEVGHRFQIIPSFYVQPSIQYIQNPGGTGDIDDAVVLGAWIGAAF